MNESSEPMMCAECGQTLNHGWVVRDGITRHVYSHPLRPVLPHDPVPVPVDGKELIVCDLCSTPDPTWDFPCRPLELGTIGVRVDSKGVMPVNWADGNPNFAVCDACKSLVEADDYGQLLVRATRVGIQLGLFPRSVPPVLVVQQMATIHQAFRVNRSGDPVRIDA